MRYEVWGGYNGQVETWGKFPSPELAEAYISNMTCNNPALELRAVDTEAVPEAESDEVAEAFDLATKAANPWLNDPSASEVG